MTIESDTNRISVKGNISNIQLRHLCAALYGIIEQRGYPDVTLDFSACSYITEAVMLPVMPIIAKYRSNGIDFDFLLPVDEKLARLFQNASWAYFMNPEQAFATFHEGGHVPALQF